METDGSKVIERLTRSEVIADPPREQNRTKNSTDVNRLCVRLQVLIGKGRSQERVDSHLPLRALARMVLYQAS